MRIEKWVRKIWIWYQSDDQKIPKSEVERFLTNKSLISGLWIFDWIDMNWYWYGHMDIWIFGWIKSIAVGSLHEALRKHLRSGRLVRGMWESSETWEASGCHLGGFQKASARMGWPWELKVLLEQKCLETIVFYCKNAREWPFRLDETRASVTKWCKNWYIRIDAAMHAAADDPRTLIQDRENPYR